MVGGRNRGLVFGQFLFDFVSFLFFFFLLYVFCLFCSPPPSPPPPLSPPLLLSASIRPFFPLHRQQAKRDTDQGLVVVGVGEGSEECVCGGAGAAGKSLLQVCRPSCF